MNFRNLLGDSLVSLETSKIKGYYACHLLIIDKSLQAHQNQYAPKIIKFNWLLISKRSQYMCICAYEMYVVTSNYDWSYINARSRLVARV